MFTIKNAIKNIYRYRNKYIIFGVLYLILILTASVCVNIFVQMRQVTDNILREYASVVTFSPWSTSVRDGYYTLDYQDEPPDWIRMLKEEYQRLPEIFKHIDDIRFLRYNFSVNHPKEDIAELNVELHIGGDITLFDSTRFEPIIVLGYDLSLIHLVPGDFDLESGRMFENGGEAVIAKNSKFIPRVWDENEGLNGEWVPSGIYEAWNDLDLGDKIVIKNDDGIYKEFTIVGIQSEKPEYDEETIRRLIYTTFESAEYFESVSDPKRNNPSLGPFRREGNRGYYLLSDRETVLVIGYEALVYLSSPENYFRLDSEVSGIATIQPFFSDFWTLTNLTRNMYHYAVLFIAIVGFILIVITIISTVILLGNRRYEIAVLRSSGMKKSRLIINYLIEKLAFIWGIAVVSLIIAPFIASPFTVNVFEGIREFVSPEFFENLTQGINFNLLVQNIGLVFGGTTVIVMMSLILACINIIRFEPLKIFNKRY